MMNLLALALITSTLATAGVFSPPAPPPHPQDPVLREGHRLIVVEYERELPSDHPTTDNIIDETKHKFREAAAALPNLGQGLSTPPATHDDGGIKDKICDAYGNCKDKVSSLLGKGKSKASVAKDALTDKLSEKATGVDNAVHNINEKISEKAMDAKAALGEATVAVKDKVSEKASQLQDGAKEAADNISTAAATAVATAEAAAANLTDIIKRAREVAYDMVKYAGAPVPLKTAAAVVQLLATAMAYGASIWVTFVSSHVLARALPRQQFGVVQSRLYPVYFRAVAYGVGVALLSHWLRRGVAGRVQGYNLATVLAAAMLNLWYFEPKATKVMFERMKTEKEEGKGQDVADVVLETPVVAATATTTAGTQTATFVSARTVTMEQEAVKNRMAKLSRRLKRLNTYSSFLNILALMGLTWHLVHLARRMQVHKGKCYCWTSLLRGEDGGAQGEVLLLEKLGKCSAV